MALTATVLLLTACDEVADHGAAGLQFVFGTTGMGAGEFSYPRAIAEAPDGRLYIVDKAARIQCYSPAGEFLFDWRMPESSAGKPTGLGIGPDGKVYAADTHYSRVMIFEPDGTPAGQFGSNGEGPGQFIMPTDVAVNAAGEIYVSEYGGNDRVSKFSPDRQYLFSFGDRSAGPAQLQRPQALLLDDDGSLWVADACNHRICHFSSDGELLSTFGHRGTGPGELRFPYGLDWLPDGSFIVAEYGNNRLQRFAAAGHSLGTWGAAGRKAGQLAYPWAVVSDPDGLMYVLDSGNNRVQVVEGLESRTWQRP
ncbi:MAG: hypothetical protein KAY37_15380 [Phycisphaerae bacterium]|nr:hypothetical protein [Phycisphaerae bacterium]